MAIEVALNTPLADALNSALQPKLVEVGWVTDGSEQSPLSEFIILMLVNGKSQEEISAELATDLLGLAADDPQAREFTRWLFEQIEILNAQINGGGHAIEQSPQDMSAMADQNVDVNMSQDTTELNVPTGPKSMRNGNARGKRMLGQMNRAMDRTHDSVLHRIRGAANAGRINAHDSRTPPTGPRGGQGRMGNRAMMNRANNMAAGMGQQMAGMPNMNDPNWMMQNPDIFSLLQQQNQMMAALSQQLAQAQNQSGHTNNSRGRGKSLFDRTQRGGHNFRGRGAYHGNNSHAKDGEPTSVNGTAADGEDIDMSGAHQAQNPETTVCRYNLACTNRDCKFAHQSPAAPPGTTVDVNDVCSFGAACKNFKCTGRHPSPATKRAHQIEQECKFFPNCTNPKCPFKHPEMPVCRNGGDCKVEGCKFTHLQTMCKFKPCTNRFCPYKHEEGQRGTFHDKVWTADGSKDHVSDRKFVDANQEEERIFPVPEVAQEATMDEAVA